MHKSTPYDAAWTTTVVLTVGFAVATFLILRTGSFNLIPVAKDLVDADAKVSVAFWGAALCSLGLMCLGVLAFRFAGSPYADVGPRWPRLGKVETEQRDPFIARVGLVVTLTICIVSIYSSLYMYVTRSRVALWSDRTALGKGFFDSRLIALKDTCNINPCYRMHPKIGGEPDAHQWFWFSDIFLASVIVATIVSWALYIVRIRQL